MISRNQGQPQRQTLYTSAEGKEQRLPFTGVDVWQKTLPPRKQQHSTAAAERAQTKSSDEEEFGDENSNTMNFNQKDGISGEISFSQNNEEKTSQQRQTKSIKVSPLMGSVNAVCLKLGIGAVSDSGQQQRTKGPAGFIRTRSRSTQLEQAAVSLTSGSDKNASKPLIQRNYANMPPTRFSQQENQSVSHRSNHESYRTSTSEGISQRDFGVPTVRSHFVSSQTETATENDNDDDAYNIPTTCRETLKQYCVDFSAEEFERLQQMLPVGSKELEKVKHCFLPLKIEQQASIIEQQQVNIARLQKAINMLFTREESLKLQCIAIVREKQQLIDRVNTLTRELNQILMRETQVLEDLEGRKTQVVKLERQLQIFEQELIQFKLIQVQMQESQIQSELISKANHEIMQDNGQLREEKRMHIEHINQLEGKITSQEQKLSRFMIERKQQTDDHSTRNTILAQENQQLREQMNSLIINNKRIEKFQAENNLKVICLSRIITDLAAHLPYIQPDLKQQLNGSNNITSLPLQLLESYGQMLKDYFFKNDSFGTIGTTTTRCRNINQTESVHQTDQL